MEPRFSNFPGIEEAQALYQARSEAATLLDRLTPYLPEMSHDCRYEVTNEVTRFFLEYEAHRQREIAYYRKLMIDQLSTFPGTKEREA